MVDWPPAAPFGVFALGPHRVPVGAAGNEVLRGVNVRDVPAHCSVPFGSAWREWAGHLHAWRAEAYVACRARLTRHAWSAARPPQANENNFSQR